jgi:hypothetical protein
MSDLHSGANVTCIDLVVLLDPSLPVLPSALSVSSSDLKHGSQGHNAFVSSGVVRHNGMILESRLLPR